MNQTISLPTTSSQVLANCIVKLHRQTIPDSDIFLTLKEMRTAAPSSSGIARLAIRGSIIDLLRIREFSDPITQSLHDFLLSDVMLSDCISSELLRQRLLNLRRPGPRDFQCNPPVRYWRGVVNEFLREQEEMEIVNWINEEIIEPPYGRGINPSYFLACFKVYFKHKGSMGNLTQEQASAMNLVRQQLVGDAAPVRFWDFRSDRVSPSSS